MLPNSTPKLRYELVIGIREEIPKDGVGIKKVRVYYYRPATGPFEKKVAQLQTLLLGRHTERQKAITAGPALRKSVRLRKGPIDRALERRHKDFTKIIGQGPQPTLEPVAGPPSR